MLSAIAVPSNVIRSANQAGTSPPCKGKSANPERFTISIFDHRLVGEEKANLISFLGYGAPARSR